MSDTLFSHVDLNIDPDFIRAQLGLGAETNAARVAAHEKHYLRWNVEVQIRKSDVYILPTVPDQELKVEVEVEPAADADVETRTLTLPMRDIEVAVNANAGLTAGMQIYPGLLSVNQQGKVSVDFFIA